MTSSVAMRQTVKTTKLHVLSHHAGTKLRNHTLLATNNNKPTLVPFIVSSFSSECKESAKDSIWKKQLAINATNLCRVLGAWKDKIPRVDRILMIARTYLHVKNDSTKLRLRSSGLKTTSANAS